MKSITKKCWPEHFRDVTNPAPSKRKTLEIRKEDDCTYDVGDILYLLEWDPITQEYTGYKAKTLVTHCLRGQPWVPDGYVAMSIHLQVS